MRQMRYIKVGIRFNEMELQELDRKKGAMTRSEYIRLLIHTSTGVKVRFKSLKG